MNIAETFKKCVEDELNSQLKRLGMADNQIAITIKTICSKDFIQRLVNVSSVQADTQPSEVPNSPYKPLRAAVKSIKLEPGKKDFQLALEVFSTSESRLFAANMGSGMVDVYPVAGESEEDGQMDIEEYAKEADE